MLYLFSDFLIPVRNRPGFFFKNNLQLSCLLKKCLYLCQILITKKEL